MTQRSGTRGSAAQPTPLSSAITPPRRLRRDEGFDALRRNGAAVVLVAVSIAATVVFPTFGTGANLRNIAVQVSFLALVALGQTFVIMTGGIDLSVGSVYALGGVLAAYGSQWGVGGALLLPLVVCALIGLTNGLLVGWARLAPFIVTLASLLGARGLLLLLTDEGATTYLVRDAPGFTWLGQGEVLTIAVPSVIAHFACRRRRPGRLHGRRDVAAGRWQQGGDP